MKRKQGSYNGEETVKRLTSVGTVLPNKHLVQPQQVTAVQLLNQAQAGPLLGGPSGDLTVEAVTAPTSVAVTVAGDPCILGGTLTYTLCGPHTSACNIILASPQTFVTSVSASTSCCISTPNPTSSSTPLHTETVPSSADSTILPFTGSAVDSTLPAYSNSTINNISGTVHSSAITANADTSYSISYNPSSLSSAPSVSAPRSAEIKTNTYRTVEESLAERKQRLSEKFNALIRAKIIELVTVRGLKKTICPSEVARALSPKAWKDLMPTVRKIGAQLVKEGIILVTQRGTIVDLSTVRGPIRFGLANVGAGSRVECDGHRGTIRWVGELPAAQGVWYGVDWDDASRGRHDGSHNNIKYFETRCPTSGSFVRPSKVNTGLTFEKAVRGRYQDDTTIEPEVTEQLQREINARFVEVVGMDKIGKKQSILEELGTAVLTRWMIWGTDETDLMRLLPRLHSVDVSNSLLSSWVGVADITRQLPSLRFLNLSGNMLNIPDHPEELKQSLSHVVHLVLNNMLIYSWPDLLTCCIMFPELKNLQMAFNKLEVLGPIPCGRFDCLEELDIGENPISSWEEICHLGLLPRLETLNANSCCLKKITFPSTSLGDKTPLFPCLKNLMLANNPLDTWECTGELNKLAVMEYLVISYNVKISPYFQEFTFARISKLKFLNRTELSPKEKRDCELFYMKTYSNEYYESGGKEDLDRDSLSQEFKEKHPTYLDLVKAHGAPVNDSCFKTQKSQKLKDLKVELKIINSSAPEREECSKSFLLTTKLAKVKMMLKRQLKINPSINLKLSYHSSKDGFEIPLDNDQQDLAFYSVESGDTLVISW